MIIFAGNLPWYNRKISARVFSQNMHFREQYCTFLHNFSEQWPTLIKTWLQILTKKCRLYYEDKVVTAASGAITVLTPLMNNLNTSVCLKFNISCDGYVLRECCISIKWTVRSTATTSSACVWMRSTITRRWFLI